MRGLPQSNRPRQTRQADFGSVSGAAGCEVARKVSGAVGCGDSRRVTAPGRPVRPILAV